jgi:hypothetical protein
MSERFYGDVWVTDSPRMWRVRFTPRDPRAPEFLAGPRFADLPSAYHYAKRNAFPCDARPLVFKERASVDAQ